MSGGVAWYPEDALDLDTLKKYADFAMYEVKHSTKGEVREFDMERYRAGVYAMEQRSDFEKLIRERRVDYCFQPIVSAHDGLRGPDAASAAYPAFADHGNAAGQRDGPVV